MYIIIYDFGTSSVKTCLFEIDSEIRLAAMDVLELARQLVKANRVYVPDPENKEIYERNYRVFRGLYKANARSFKALNA